MSNDKLSITAKKKNKISIKEKKYSNNSVIIIAFLIIISILLFNHLKEQNENLLNTVNGLNKKVEVMSQDNREIDNSQVVQPIQQNQKQIIDNDPIVECPKGDDCGGGYKKIEEKYMFKLNLL